MQEILGESELMELLREVTKELQLDLTGVGPETTLESMGLDSLDQFELLTALEDKMGLRIPDGRIGEIVTIKDVIDCLRELQQPEPAG
jgi:acyl carrier protein